MHEATLRSRLNRPDRDVWALIGYILEGKALGVEQKKVGMNEGGR
jgi:hypothetical protein